MYRLNIANTITGNISHAARDGCGAVMVLMDVKQGRSRSRDAVKLSWHARSDLTLTPNALVRGPRPTARAGAASWADFGCRRFVRFPSCSLHQPSMQDSSGSALVSDRWDWNISRRFLPLRLAGQARQIPRHRYRLPIFGMLVPSSIFSLDPPSRLSIHALLTLLGSQQP
jgi:hypothetical protein